MGENTQIQWASHTFNPWIGCQRVSPGCEHCYAETFDKRVGGGVDLNDPITPAGDTKKSGDMAEWPAELRVREFPGGKP